MHYCYYPLFTACVDGLLFAICIPKCIYIPVSRGLYNIYFFHFYKLRQTSLNAKANKSKWKITANLFSDENSESLNSVCVASHNFVCVCVLKFSWMQKYRMCSFYAMAVEFPYKISASSVYGAVDENNNIMEITKKWKQNMGRNCERKSEGCEFSARCVTMCAILQNVINDRIAVEKRK